MKRRFFGLVSVATLGVLFVSACGGDSSSTNPTSTGSAPSPADSASPTDLVAKKQAPASLAVDDPAWTGVSVTTAKTEVIKESKGKAPVDVKVQALYNDSDIWFRFQWSDATNNNLPNYWQYDGTKFTTVANTSERLGLYWEMAPVADFEARGCLALCHKGTGDTIDKWYMIAPNPTDQLDLWQWTAASSAFTGGTDYHIGGAQSGDPTSSAYRESAIAPDPGTGGTVTNANATNDGPKVMQDPSKTTPLYGPNYLVVSEAVTLDVTKLKAGDKISKTQLAPFVGDRADIESKVAWANGQYTVVFHRKLDTGNPDDVKFTVGGTFTFGLAVWDALDQENHTVTGQPYHLILK
jgi:Ethylbenzene dehydrogenase